MASSGNFTTTNQYIVFWIEVIQNSQNISNNTSNVTVKVWIKRTNTGYTTYGSGTVFTNIDGVQRNVSITPSQKITSTPSAIFHQDITVNHNSDGTKILNVQVGISHDQFSSSQSSVAFNTSLTTIPRSSSISLSASTIEAGKELTVNITRASGSFTHNVYLLFGTATFPIQNGVATSAKGVISLDTLKQIPNATSGWGTVRCDTYNGGTKIGATEKNITITAPTTIVPSYSSLKVTRVDNVVPSTWGVYVKGKSKVTLEIVGAAGTYGSTISKYSITGDDQSSTSSKYTTGVLNNSGTVTFTGVVTDSRGRTATKTANISVIDYSSPKITDFLVQRCNSGGTLTDEGTYVKVTPKWSYSSVNSKNTFSAKVDYKTKAATNWSTATTVTTSDSSYIIGGGDISANTSYDIRLTIQDAFETVTKTITIPTAKTTLDFRNGGNGIAVGKVAESDGFEVDWNSKFNKQVDVEGTANLKGDVNVSSKTNLKLGGVSLIDMFYPVGSIYMSTSSTNPSNFMGGTWVAWGSGRVPVGVNTSDSDFNTVEKTGGAKTQELRALIGAVNNNTLTLGYNPVGAVGGIRYTNGYGVVGSNPGNINTINHSTLVRRADGNNATTIQPYITCYMFKRTA